MTTKADPALLSIPDLEGKRKQLIEQLKKNAVKTLGEVT